MFLLSIRLSRKRIVAGVVALVMLVGFSVILVRARHGGDAMAATTQTETTKSAKAKRVVVKSDEDRVAFVRAFGWEIEQEPAEVLEVIIPEEFDNVYTEYNAIQKKQGYDLERYAGKRCKRYSYVIANYPQYDGEVHFNLLLYKNKVVGGDVCATEQGGFIHGFAAQ